MSHLHRHVLTFINLMDVAGVKLHALTRQHWSAAFINMCQYLAVGGADYAWQQGYGPHHLPKPWHPKTNWRQAERDTRPDVRRGQCLRAAGRQLPGSCGQSFQQCQALVQVHMRRVHLRNNNTPTSASPTFPTTADWCQLRVSLAGCFVAKGSF